MKCRKSISIKLDGLATASVERYLVDEERRLANMCRQLAETIKMLRLARAILIKSKRATRGKKHEKPSKPSPAG